MITSIKTCFKCGVEKPLTEFYKHSAMKDGTVNKCKECNKKDVIKNREDKLDYYQNYDRNRFNLKERIAKNNKREKEKYNSDPSYRAKVIAQKEKWRLENPNKRKAQHAANNALRDGKIEKQTICEHCEQDGLKLHKHHWSYLPEHWLDIVWLCTSCHGKEHKRLNELGRDPDITIKAP